MMNKNGSRTKIQVFYDGACGLCAKEINHYKKIAPPDVFEWVDIMVTPEAFEALGYKKEDGLRALHARDKNATMHIGVDAFILIWRQMKAWRVLAVIIALPIIKHIAQFLYKRFANWRFKKLGYSCAVNPKK